MATNKELIKKLREARRGNKTRIKTNSDESTLEVKKKTHLPSKTYGEGAKHIGEITLALESDGAIYEVSAKWVKSTGEYSAPKLKTIKNGGNGNYEEEKIEDLQIIET